MMLFSAPYCLRIVRRRCTLLTDNYFMSVLAEPGVGSQYFDFDQHSLWNTVIGQDNCFRKSASRDTNFMWLQQGKVRVGDFNTTLNSTGAPPQLEQLELQVEGHGYIRQLSTGFPMRHVSLLSQHAVQSPLEIVEDEPMMMTAVHSHRLRIEGLGHIDSSGSVLGGAWYEVSLAGSGHSGSGDEADESSATTLCTSDFPCIYAAKWMVVPSFAAGKPTLTIQPLAEMNAELVGGRKTVHGTGFEVQLRRATVKREITVEVKRVGRPILFNSSLVGFVDDQ